MARGSNLNGRWGNGRPYESVRRTGFTENTITEPTARQLPPEDAPILLQLSEPWYETPSRVNRIRENELQRSQTGGATEPSSARGAELDSPKEPVVENRGRGWGIPKKPAFK